MFGIADKKAGDFIDLENYFKTENWHNFFVTLTGDIPRENTYEKILKDYLAEVVELKEQYEWIYNPPQMPSNSEEQKQTYGMELRKEFAEHYGGYTELVYLICNSDITKVSKVMEMKTSEFLFWGEYLLRKRIIEQVK